MTKPNLFIIGAPKCGTSSLATYLRGHPNIFMAWPKEPLHFCEDFPNARVVESAEEYLQLFEHVSPEVAYAGEASAMYLYSEVALKRIREFSPNASIIAMVRNPVDLAQAFHAQLLFSLAEDEPIFARAWALQEQRRAGSHLPRGCPEPKFLQYRDVALLGKQLERLFSIFPPDQVHVISFDDFATDTQGVYRGALAFLGLEDDDRQIFEHVNATPSHRWRLISQLTQRAPSWAVKSAQVVKSALGLDVSLLDWVRRANSRPAIRESLPESLRLEMIESFRSDVDRLSSVLARDFSGWMSKD